MVLNGRSADKVERIRAFLRSSPSRSGQLKLQQVVQDAESLLRQEMMYQRVEFNVVLPPADVPVVAEALPLTQALVQVLRNAMQAVHDRTLRTITVTLSAQGSEAHIEVQDSGGGFSRHMLSRISGGDLPLVEERGGLGLYMTQEILRQFKGQLVLDNTPSGGAVVRLILPLAAKSPEL